MESILAVVIGVLLILLLGAGYQALAEVRDLRRHTVPGRLERINGRFVHLDCRGEGAPTVVLESGLGGSSLDWFEVQPRLAALTRVCSYDRPGLGWSRPGRGAWSSERAAIELERLLKNTGERDPFVLVGWSAGGVMVRDFAHLFPKKVAGLVLVDSAHENQGMRLPPEVVGEEHSVLVLEVCRLLAPLGVPRLLGVMAHNTALFGSGEVRDALVASRNRRGFCGALLREQAGFRNDIVRRDPPRSLGDLPLVVVSRTMRADPGKLPAEVLPETGRRAEEVSALLQAELAALSDDSVQLFATSSGHAIPLEEPDLVVVAVQELLARLHR